ncbi:uncharacterized protein LOC126816138 isoform X1 [Patella vulgata]|uniref:uncharacterized protein LOC126816138 isoform X1 n=2 Tax=Patella vulgata TaxID=6465 RepID=UPI00217FB264|nr:uncharacterized protein LOC126816138 isoform X1 [Patella vulgata]
MDLKRNEIERRRQAWKDVALDILQQCGQMDKGALLNAVAKKLNLTRQAGEYYDVSKVKKLFDIYSSCFLIKGSMVDVRPEGDEQDTAGPSQFPKTPNLPKQPSKKEKLENLEEEVIKIINDNGGEVLSSNLWQLYSKYYKKSPRTRDFHVLNMSDVLQGMDRIVIFKKDKKEYLKVRGTPSRSSSISRDEAPGPWLKPKGTPSSSRSSSMSRDEVSRPWGAGAIPKAQSDFLQIQREEAEAYAASRKGLEHQKTKEAHFQGPSKTYSGASPGPSGEGLLPNPGVGLFGTNPQFTNMERPGQSWFEQNAGTIGRKTLTFENRNNSAIQSTIVSSYGQLVNQTGNQQYQTCPIPQISPLMSLQKGFSPLAQLQATQTGLSPLAQLQATQTGLSPISHLQAKQGPSHMLQGSISNRGDNRSVSSDPVVVSSDESKSSEDEEDVQIVSPPKVDKLERKEIHVGRINFQQGRLPGRAQIEEIAQDCIEVIADANEYVSIERIEKLLLQRLNLHNLNQLQLRKIDQIKCVYEHLRTVSRINAYVHAFIKTHSIYSLHELYERLREFVPEKGDFEKLHLGPLQRLPVIYDMFKFPQDVLIPQITTIDILEYIRDFMTKNNKWTERLEMDAVMTFIVQERQAASGYHLGIGIKSLPLAAQVLKKAQRDAANSKKSVYEHYKQNAEKEISEAFRKFRTVMLAPANSGENEIRSHYLKMTPENVLMEIFKKYNTLMSCENPTTRAEMRRQAKMKEGIKNFISLMRDDDLAKVLFHIAICASDSILKESAFEMMASQAEGDQSKDTGETSKSQDTDNSVPDPVNRPSRSKVLEYLKEFLERCLQHGALTLANLCRIEEKMTSEMGASEFSDVGFGRFLSFITTDADAKNLLSECGGSILGSSMSGVDTAGGVFKPSHSDVLVFIRQCSNSGIQQAVDIENALCNQFKVREVKQLGYGSTSTLISASSKSGRHRANDYMVIYEGSLTPASRSTSAGPKQMGCLGHQTKDTALLMLHNCPLLTDMIQWTHWSLVFEPELGPLKDFVQKYGGKHMIKLEGDSKIITTDIFALETKPGVLLKLSGQSTTEQFCKALERTDVIETSGHLVSLIVCNKGVENTPIALLANQMKTTLFKLHSEAPSHMQGGEKYRDPAVDFVLHCLSVLPKQILYATATQIFLEPLSSVVGSTKSKTLLLKACNNQHQETCLEEMGCLFGIGEWSQNLLHKATPRKCDIEIIGDEFAADLVDESEDEEPIEIESDSDVSFLSDDEGDKVISTPAVVPPVVETIELSEDDKPIILSDEPDSTVEEFETKETEKTSDEDSKLEDGEREKVEDVEIKDGDKGDVEDAEKKEKAEEKEEEIFVEPHQAFVELIRKEEFGVGIELNADGQRLIKIHQERQGRSLDRLSKDLYSKDTHFVLELIQNADDNSYSDEVVNSTQGPSVKFVVDESCITLLNNEVGFKEKEIKALCDVGCSTKGKHKYGYIGQKGIGFKSVFRITDKPEIHSNGYHFCFDVKSGPMGYIMPHWLEIQDEKPQDWMTKIALPFKPEMISQSRSLAAKFNDIHPSLLLFLHRLKEISIDNQLEDSVLKMKRTDYDNIVEIKHGDTTDRWLVVKKMLDCTNLSIQAKSGVEVESTEIALAFPLKPNYKKHLQVLPDKQLVFAFLPLRNYGFRFIVQGDFDVPSSRECVDRDSAWNQWIRNEIHNLFIESLEVFKAHEEFTEIEALLAFLQFVPMEDEILDFFKPVATQILAKLRAKECLPVVTGKDGNYQWKIPSQTVIVQDSLLREVISPDLLLKHLNLHYLCKDVAAMLTPSLAQNLGVEFIRTEHLLQIGRSLSQTFVSNQTEKSERVTIIAKWMACVYRSLDEFNTDEKIFNEIRCMKILPLSTGELTSLSNTTVFLTPVDRSTRNKRRNDPLSKIEQDLNTVDSGLITTEDNEINSQVEKLLQLVDVKQLSPDDLIHHHILPVLRSEDWKNKDRDILINYVMYIKDQYERQPSIVNLEELKSIVQIATNHGFKNPKKDSIHFTARYNNPIDLQRQLQGYDWVLVDGEYLTQGPVGLAAQQWRDFLTKLGVIDFLDVRSKDITIMPDNLDKTPWAVKSDTLPSSLNGYIISDFICDEFQALVTKNRNPETFNHQMKILFAKLDQEWDSIYSKFKTTSIRSADGQILRTVDSSFGLYLKSLKWVPAVDFNTDETDQRIKVNVKEVNMKASDLYVRDPGIEKILAHTVNYIQCNVLAASSFSKFLEIKKTLEVSMLKDLLIKWGKRSEEDKPVTFVGSLKQIQAIYLYLRDNLKSKESQDLFIDNSVIFVPKDKQDPDPLKLVVGEMLKRDEIWWNDTSSLFIYHHKLLIEYHLDIANKHIISSFYPTKEFEKFFQTICRVQMNPNMSDYAELLVLLSTVHLPTHKSIFSNVLQIYSLIATSLTINDSDDFTLSTMKENERTKIVQRLSKQKIFCSKANIWVSLADKPMIADNLELEKKFAGEENVHFLKLTTDSKDKNTKFKRRDTTVDPRVMMFIKMFPIPNLSDSVESTSQTKLLQPCPKVQLFMHHVIPLIQRFIYTHYHDDIYTECKQSNMAEIVSSLQFFQTDVLEVIYKLKHISGVMLPHTENCVLKGDEFLVDKKYAENYGEIIKEIAKFFSKGNNKLMKELRHFLLSITHIINKRSEDSIDDVLNEEEVDDLPEEEIVWSIKAPIIIPPVVVPPPPPVEQPASEAQSESGNTEKTLRSWPPRAPDNPNAQQRSDVTFKPLGAKLWPPPAPEGFVAKSRTDFLPSNIKVVAAETDEKTTDAADPSKNSENLRPCGDRMANEDGAARRPRSSEGPMNTDTDGVVRRPSGTSRQSSTVSSTGGGSRPVSREVDGRPTSQDLSKSDGSAGDSRKRKIDSNETEDNNETKRHAPSSPEDNVDVTATMPEKAQDQTQPIETSPSPESETNRQHRSPSRPLDPNHKRPFNFDAPKWQESSSVIPYEDLPLGDRPSLNIDVSDDPENERLVGRWGEQVVYDYLLQQKAANKNILDVNWVNEKCESGDPYDFIITYRSEKGEQLTLYSEVKSTRSDAKRMLETSMPEVKFAMDQCQNYEIYRLFNAGTSNNVRLVRISNIMDKDNIKLYMFI